MSNKEELARMIREAAGDYDNPSLPVVVVVANMAVRIAELEAENKRLRGAIETHRRSFTTDFYTEEDKALWAALQESGDVH